LSAALEAAGMPDISLYEGTKHSFARDAIRRGVPERHLQTFLGHASIGDARGGRIVVMDAVGALRSHGGSVQIGGAGGGVMAFA